MSSSLRRSGISISELVTNLSCRSLVFSLVSRAVVSRHSSALLLECSSIKHPLSDSPMHYSISRKAKAQGDREGRPYSTTASLSASYSVGATLAVALAKLVSRYHYQRITLIDRLAFRYLDFFNRSS